MQFIPSKAEFSASDLVLNLSSILNRRCTNYISIYLKLNDIVKMEVFTNQFVSLKLLIS